MPRRGVHEQYVDELVESLLVDALVEALGSDLESEEEEEGRGTIAPLHAPRPTSLVLPQIRQPAQRDTIPEALQDYILDELVHATNSRYLQERRPVLRTGHFIDILFDNKTYRPSAFRDAVRVSPGAFDYIMGCIEDDAVFETVAGHTQITVPVQLSVFLYRLGHYGNSASVGSVAQLFGLRKGTIVKITNRVLLAISRSHALRANVRWPLDADREQSKNEAAARSIPEWRGGWCGVEGTTVPLSEKPLLYGPAWYDRKGRYSMNMQIINDHQMNIIDFSVGRTGSRCDPLAFEDTRLAQHHDQMLGPGEWCWGDAGYKRQDWLVIPYTRPLRDLPKNRHFHYYLSSIRISSEHTIGWLKGRWQCLKELRVKTKTEQDVQYACEWLRAAVFLHQAAKWTEQANADEDPFYVAGAAWELAERNSTAADSTTADGNRDEARAADIARADEFRDALKALLLKRRPPRPSRRG